MARLFATYQQLDELYKSKKSRAEKLAEKEAIIDTLVADLKMWTRPNNASLVELRLYKASYDTFARVHEACGKDTGRLLTLAAGLKKADFPERLASDLSKPLALLERRCAEAAPAS